MANTLTKDKQTAYDPGQAAIPAQWYRAPRPAWTERRSITRSGITSGSTIPAHTISSGPTFDISQKTAVVDGNTVTIAGWPRTYTYKNVPAVRIPGKPYIETETIVINHPADPGQPHLPAVAYRPPSTTVNFNLGWNASARSVEAITGSGGFEFKVSLTAMGAVAGLNSVDTTLDYSDIRHGLYFERGAFKVVESGVDVADTDGSYIGMDVFHVQRNFAGQVRYFKNAVLVYTSLVASTGTVFLDSSLYSGDDFIDDPKRVEFSSAVSIVAFPPLTGFASNSATYSQAFGSFEPLTGSGGLFQNRSSNSLQPLTGRAGLKYAESRNALLPLSGSASSKNLNKPNFALASGVMHPLAAGFAYSSESVGPVTSNNFMRPLAGQASEGNYAAADNSFFPMIAWAYEGLPPVITMPSPVVTITGSRPNDDSILATMPSPVVTAYGGASALSLTMPSPVVSAGGTVQNLGNITAAMPRPVVISSGTAGSAGSITAAMPMPTLVSYAGAILSATLTGQMTVVATGTTGAVGSITAVMPLFTLTASGTVQSAISSLNAIMPAPILVQGAVAYIVMPGFVVTAIGQATVSLLCDTYAVNLKHTAEDQPDQVSRYTRFNFDRIVRWQGSYFGMNADGLFLLEGTTDFAEPMPLPIPVAMRTHATDFGATELKTIVSVYMGARLGPAETVTLHVGEKSSHAYPYTTPRGATPQNYRQRFGRGIKSRYFALALSGSAEFELDSIDFEIDKMKRRI